MKLSERVAALRGASDSEVDVLCEVALFVPHGEWQSARANSAGTKVIYTHSDGHEQVCWADQYTDIPGETIAALEAFGL